MKCCGHEQSTPFCAYCGENIGADQPLVGLLLHVQRYTKAETTRLAVVRNRLLIEEAGDDRDREKRLRRYRGAVDKGVASLAKWAAWEQSLIEIVNTDAADP